jgi:non-ribosomal peptide synthetase component E (peptide arylation enzyme)
MFMIKQNPTEFCDHRKIHHAFEKNSDLNPSFIAVEKGDRYFSYKELNDQAQEVADQLNSPDLATKKLLQL